MRLSVRAIFLGLLSVAPLHAQSGGRDLPRGFRSLAGVTLNEDSAATIRTKLGHTRERRIGVEHDPYINWCYLPADGTPAGLLELMSDASVMGTPGRELTVIRLRAGAPSEDRVGCAQLPTSAQLSTPAGLQLGIDAAKIEQLLGKPKREGADSLVYYFDAKEYLRPDSPAYKIWNTPEHRETCFDAGLPYVNVSATIIVLLRDGRAAEIRIERDDQAIC